MARQRYQVFDAVVPQARPQTQMTDNPMHLQSHGVFENQKPYMMAAPPHPMDPRGQMMSGNGVPGSYPPLYPPQGMEMQGQYPNPYSYQQFDVRSGPSGQSAPLSASTSRQNRRAQQAARNSQKANASQKRKITTPSLPSDDDESDSDGEVPDGQNPSAADIARNKYNHVEDEKERKRLKRLLRNRVSAQQARERKKAYMGNLEDRLRALESRNEELEERANTLEKENSMLRQLLKTQTAKNAL